MFDFKVNIELYRIFYTTAVLGNMTKAAEQLYIGQPAVSKSIKSIEEKLNTTLFLRTPQGLVLTDEGKALFIHISEAMKQIKLAEDTVSGMRGTSEKPVRIEVCAMQYKVLILPHLKTFFERCGNSNLDISPTTDSYSSLKRLEDGEIDCCILTRPVNLSHLKFIGLFAYHDYLMGAPDYIKSITKNGQDLVRNAVLISVVNDSIMSYYEKRRLKNLHFASKMKVTSMDHTISLAKLGCGVGFIAKELVADELEHQKLSIVDIPYSRHKREVGFLLNKNTPIDRPLKEFIDFYCNFYPGIAPEGIQA